METFAGGQNALFNFYTHIVFEFNSRTQATKTVNCLKFV